MKFEQNFHQPVKHTEKIWYDLRTESIGWGQTYGEHSFNGKPIGAKPLSEYHKNVMKPLRSSK